MLAGHAQPRLDGVGQESAVSQHPGRSEDGFCDAEADSFVAGASASSRRRKGEDALSLLPDPLIE